MTSSTNIRFDVGCAATAPNSAMWILKYHNIQVHAFEPDYRSYNILKYGKKTNQYPDKPRIISNKNIVLYKKKILKNFSKKNFYIYNCCIDNIAKKKIFFYYTSKKNYGCSSVKKPIEKKLKIKINYKKRVDVYPLSFFLKKKNIIQMLKTDTQGNDLQVLKSAGDYIKKVLFVQSEYWTRQVYYGEGTKEIERERVISYMATKNFSCYYYTDIDIFFVNNEFKNYIIKNNIVDDCIDFPNGLYKQSLWFNRINGMLIFYCILRDALKPILKNIFGQRLTALRQVLKKSLFE